MSDNWVHRSENMKCRTCMWFAEKTAYLVKTTEGMIRELQNTGPGKVQVFDDTGEVLPTKIGRCRRHAPTMNGFPVVYPDDWCGDHKLDEGKA